MTTLNPDALDDVRLSGTRGPDHEPSYPVDEIRFDDGVLILRRPPGLPASVVQVWTRTMSPRFLLDRLAQGLRGADRTPLADALVSGTTAGPPTSAATQPGLLPEQLEAFRACLSPGVRLVWGPPGTGKTRVLASAIEELVRRGQRVLLVSTANIAVDNALNEVVRRLAPKPGTAIRVGPAQLKEIAADPNVQLGRLAAVESASVDRQRDEVALQLREFEAQDVEVASLRGELGDYSDDAYLAASARIEAERTRADLRLKIDEAADAVAVAEQARTRAVAMLDEARTAQAALDGVRRAMAHERQAADELAELDGRQIALEVERDAVVARRPPSGWLAKRRHARELSDAVERLRRFVVGNADRRSKLRTLRRHARAAVGATMPADLDEVDRRVAATNVELDATESRCAHAARELAALKRARDDTLVLGVPSEDDRDLVARAAQHRFPEAFARLKELEAESRQRGFERGALEERHRDLVDRSRKLRADAEKQLVREARVVATTLARARVHRAVATEMFDVVLVDEAGAATFAEVVLAVCRARSTAVLLGDFLQLGPVLDGAIKNSGDQGLSRWVGSTCFSWMGITTPRQAIAHPGCTALLHQFRFGPELRRLANDVIYEVLRDANELPDVRASTSTDIVLVDVSTVSDLADVRRPASGGSWWLAGVVLGSALAELHLPEGRVGVVTPYRAQSEVLLQALEDRKVVAGAAVGTVHSFQGREFPTVIFDLVDGGEGWIAKARHDRGTWEADGVKLFGVGITRARDRLYVIVDGRAVRGASRGPLLRLRRGLERREVRSWSAAALLGRDEPGPGLIDDTFTEVSQLLRQLVTVTDVSDEHSFSRELVRHLSTARHSAWMWSPWIANQAKVVVPLIADAVQRGVDVRVFIRPDDDRNMATKWAQRQLPDLYASGATVIRADHEHRKIVVIDGAVVLLGSLNALSNAPGTTREVMITMEGRAFARRLLEELQVEEVGSPRACVSCGLAMEVRRHGGRKPEVYWHCRSCDQRVPLQRNGSADPPHRTGPGRA